MKHFSPVNYTLLANGVPLPSHYGTEILQYLIEFSPKIIRSDRVTVRHDTGSPDKFCSDRNVEFDSCIRKEHEKRIHRVEKRGPAQTLQKPLQFLPSLRPPPPKHRSNIRPAGHGARRPRELLPRRPSRRRRRRSRLRTRLLVFL